MSEILEAIEVLGDTSGKYAKLRMAVAQRGITRLLMEVEGEGDQPGEIAVRVMTAAGEARLIEEGNIEQWEEALRWDWVQHYSVRLGRDDPLFQMLERAIYETNHFHYDGDGSRGYLAIDLTREQPVHVFFEYPETVYTPGPDEYHE